MGLFDTDELLPEVIALVVILVGVLVFVFLSPYISLGIYKDTIGQGGIGEDTGLSLNFKQNVVIYYLMGGIVILGIGLVLKGIYTISAKKERLWERNHGMHLIIWGSAMVLATIAVQTLLFATPRIT